MARTLFLAFSVISFQQAGAQGCPPNIDFETGSFSNWTCYIGSVAAIGGQNVISLTPSGGPIVDRHTMYDATVQNGVDPYGGFSVNCPNGSGHSIRLGNDQGGGQAEGVSYEFTIPANKSVYSLIYHYAVVFQDPNHQEYEQPRMEIEVMNVTDNKVINCSSFTFIPYGTVLPGFFLSTTPAGDAPVWCKDWSAVSVNLDGNAGKTIRLFFKTADCTFRRHFGYAYIDVNSECSGEFVGATYCSDDTAVNVTAPFGYQQYTWFNSNFSQVLGHSQTLVFNPPPAAGTTVAVEVVPYNGYGCLDTLYAKLIDTLTIVANAGPDEVFCSTPVQLGVNPKLGWVYSWTPSTGLNNTAISNPFASPSITSSYILTARNSGGGCLSRDTVLVHSAGLDNTMTLAGQLVYCTDSGDSTIFRVKAADSIQWYRNGIPITGAHGTEFRPVQSGSYYAMLFSFEGCSLATEKRDVLIDSPRPGIRYPLQYAVENLPMSLQARTFGTSVVWTPDNYLTNPTSVTPVFKSPVEQEYRIEITTATGCLTIDTQLVKTVKNVDIYVPTAFTPNNDGLNDLLRPTLMGVKKLNYFRVYNRWGQMMYETATERAGWDGRLRGLEQGSQVVVWTAEGLGVDGKIYMKKGTSVLVR